VKCRPSKAHPPRRYPVRVVVPGIVAARSVKWVSKVVAATEENDGFWQQRDYKSFNPSTDWDDVDFSKAPAIQDVPVCSATCDPPSGTSVAVGESVELKGYAWSGGGRSIIRVDVSLDGGKTWQVADVKPTANQEDGRAWAWSLWTVRLLWAMAFNLIF
jgi:sulfite oxidase